MLIDSYAQFSKAGFKEAADLCTGISNINGLRSGRETRRKFDDYLPNQNVVRTRRQGNFIAAWESCRHHLHFSLLGPFGCKAPSTIKIRIQCCRPRIRAEAPDDFKGFGADLIACFGAVHRSIRLVRVVNSYSRFDELMHRSASESFAGVRSVITTVIFAGVVHDRRNAYKRLLNPVPRSIRF